MRRKALLGERGYYDSAAAPDHGGYEAAACHDGVDLAVEGDDAALNASSGIHAWQRPPDCSPSDPAPNMGPRPPVDNPHSGARGAGGSRAPAEPRWASEPEDQKV